MTLGLCLQELLCKLVFLAQLAVSAVALAGDAIFRALNMPPPAIYLEYREKKMGVLVGVWILGNMVQNALTQTGAFEVYSAGELVSLPPRCCVFAVEKCFFQGFLCCRALQVKPIAKVA